MNLADLLAKRAAQPPTTHRVLCPQCRKALPTCYCHALKPFTAPCAFVILQHEAEARNTIATARMAHLSIANSQLYVGRGFDQHRAIDRLIAAPDQRHLLLYPSAEAQPLAQVLDAPRAADPRPLVFWLLDAKWAQVPKMLRLSPNLKALPMVSFQPPNASRFQLRRQPRPTCLSTIEAIHLVIDEVYARQGGGDERPHDALLEVFQYLVQQQLGFVDPERASRHEVSKRLRAARRLLQPAGQGRSKDRRGIKLSSGNQPA